MALNLNLDLSFILDLNFGSESEFGCKMLQQTKTHNERHTEIPQNTHKTTKKTTKTTKTKKTNKKTIKK
jgi:hypothetical protein